MLGCKGSCRPALVVALAALVSLGLGTPGQAQIVFDGNILWNNSTNASESSQYTGTAGAGAASCPVAYSAEQLGTVTFANNTWTNPFLSGALDIVNPDWRPGYASPAWPGVAPHGTIVNVPSDGFFEPVCYVGALPQFGDDWTEGWTYYDSLGTGRQDLHLGGMPDPRPLVILDNVSAYTDLTLDANTNYLVRGKLRVKNQATLTIPAGVVVFEERATQGTIIVERGGRIVAEGTADDPIIITTDAPPGTMQAGDIGGIVIHGWARGNRNDTCNGDSTASEGGLVGYWGGNDDADSSGVLRYVRVEYAGAPISPNNELNAFTFNGLGSRTVCEYLQAHRGKDDLFEWFGGVGRAKHLVGTDGDDDGLDWQLGYRGQVQFAVVRLLASNAGAERGIEADNNEFDNEATLCSGLSNPTFSNLTLIGDRRSGAGLTGVVNGIVLRRGTAGQILNSIIYNFKSPGFRIDGDPTFEHHCAAVPSAPGIFCGSGTVDVPVLQEGTVFLTRSYPNPFRKDLAISFTLARASDVKVVVYGVDGTAVATLADGAMPAGENVVTWRSGSDLPSGVYLYRVTANDRSASGKVLKVN